VLSQRPVDAPARIAAADGTVCKSDRGTLGLMRGVTIKQWHQATFIEKGPKRLAGMSATTKRISAALKVERRVDAYSPVSNTAMNASCGMFTDPMLFIRSLPFFCFSSSFRLRLTSPP